MLKVAAPLPDRLLIAPELKREELALLVEALEPLDRDESVDLLHLGPQGGSKPQVVLLASARGPHLEDHCHHRKNALLARDKGRRMPGAATFQTSEGSHK